MIGGTKIKVAVSLLATLLLSSAINISSASAETVDTFIRQLKDPSPDVRSKAAYELGGG